MIRRDLRIRLMNLRGKWVTNRVKNQDRSIKLGDSMRMLVEKIPQEGIDRKLAFFKPKIRNFN